MVITFIAVHWWVWLTGYLLVVGFAVLVFPHIEDLIDQERWGVLRVIATVSIFGVCCAVFLFVSVISNIVFAVT